MQQEPPPSIVGLMHLRLHIPHCQSLKDKRSVLKSCITKVRADFNLAVAEVGDQDIWRSAILALVTVANDKTHVERVLDAARKQIARHHDIDIVDVGVEII